MTHWQRTVNADGIEWLSINERDHSANSLSKAVLEELQQCLQDIAKAPPKGLVIQSSKPSGFIAGADVNEFANLSNEKEALTLIQKGQQVLLQLARLPFPTLALIDGFCLGGGLELVLACDYRIAINKPATRFGFPEVKLGIHPGLGGTVRACAAVGSLNALNLMLTGRSLSAKQAQRMGLVDECVAPRLISNVISYYVHQRPSKKPLPLKEKILRSRLSRPLLAHYLRKLTAKKARKEHYPAPFALIELWSQHVHNPLRMYPAEAESVARLITSNTAKNLLRVFQLQNQLKASGKASAFTVRHVHVVGAGTMGGDIAAWCALKGLTVSVEDANTEALAAMLKRANTLFSRRFREYPTLKTAALDRLTPDPKSIGRQHADIIIEAISENEKAKQVLFKELESSAKPSALLATNTSSIPLEKIASVLKDKGRLIGLHFFNPVAKMPLVEVIHSEETHTDAIPKAQSFCRQIDKLPLAIKSAPGFLVNRVLMPYLLEAALLHSEGISTADIDKAAKDFGMPMGPLELADTIGLDICLHVAEQLAEPMGLVIPETLKHLTTQGKLGKKTGTGFYHYKKNKKIKPKPTQHLNQEIQNRLIRTLLDEAQHCMSDGIVKSADDIDAGIIFGTGFAPFHGGPLCYQADVDKKIRANA
jgi:3-hydroxyacyl-CoA dehydrogenase/enoyl-CoA hydratase/3-hydroxybutyryl-CoA epimerase